MKRRGPREPIYRTAIVIGRGLFGFWGLRRTVHGVEQVPATDLLQDVLRFRSTRRNPALLGTPASALLGGRVEVDLEIRVR